MEQGFFKKEEFWSRRSKKARRMPTLASALEVQGARGKKKVQPFQER